MLRFVFRFRQLSILVTGLALGWLTPALVSGDDSPKEIEAALEKAGDNRTEIERALADAPAEERKGMEFLVVNMPDRDLRTLSADFLLTNSALAWRARRELPWGRDVPEAIFLNDVLAYVNLDETREPWRQEMFDLCLPIVKECRTPSEAAHKLNVEIFPKLNLKYSTKRAAPNQSPKESISQGLASCTGLSIVLSDACRSVCIPARLVGTPLWANKRGNHTWVEIWDGDWHFTGACEPDKQGLDRGWFVGDAAQAKKDTLEHAIYASSFAKTKQHFPLVWAMRNQSVPAENVTDRYARQPAEKKITRVLVRVVDSNKQRVETGVKVVSTADPQRKFAGKSRGETADTNDILGFDLIPGQVYEFAIGDMSRKITVSTDDKEQIVEITLP